MSTTTIRVRIDTRDKLQGYAADHLPGANVDEVVSHLLVQAWMNRCIEQADNDDPLAKRRDRLYSQAMDERWTPESAA